MDPVSALGAAAAAEQFLKDGFKLVQLIRSVHSKCQGAPQEIAAWREEIETLLELVDQVEASPALRNGDIDTRSTIEGCRSICHNLVEVFTRLDFAADDSLVHKTWKAIKGLEQEPEIRTQFEDLQRLKTTLVGQISLAQSAQGYQSAQDIRDIATNVQQIQKTIQPGSDQDRCLRDLFLTDPTDDRDAIITAKGDRVDGTCEWITTTDEYSEWIKAHSELLWLSGGPGKGKTFLSIFLTKRLEEPGHTVIYFFCDNKVASRNTGISILRGLIYQLVNQYNHLISHLVGPWRVQQAALFNDNALEGLWRIFQAMVEDLKGTKLYCVLDGLDECIEDSLALLLRKFETLFSSDRSTKHTLRLAILSRRYPNCLERSLGAFPQINLDYLPDSGVQHDIDCYITVRVQQIADRKAMRQKDLINHIEQTFREMSQGTFLWVSFMAEDLEKRTIAGIEEALHSLPRGLDEVYKRILLQIKPENMSVIANILRWVVLALQPLTVPQLAEAVGIASSKYVSRDQVCLSYIELCGHLLQVHFPLDTIDSSSGDSEADMSDGSSKTFGYGDDTAQRSPEESSVANDAPSRPSQSESPATVTLVHQSAKDFLLQQSKSREVMAFHIQQSKENFSITKQLFHSMQNEWFESVRAVDPVTFKQLDAHPLSHYAYLQWEGHMRQLDDAMLFQLVEENKSFFAEASVARDSWRQVEPADRPQPLLYFACQHELSPLVEKLLHRKRRTSPFTLQRYIDRQSQGTALAVAIGTGNVPIVEKLLHFGASVDMEYSSGNLGDNALRFATQRGNLDIFRLLEATKGGQRVIKADLKSQKARDSLLHVSASQGHVQLCRTFLEKYRYGVDTIGGEDQTPLHSAIGTVQTRVARLLVEEWGASIARTDNIIDVLTDSLLFGSEQEPLLDLIFSKWGVDINYRNDSGGTILHRVFECVGNIGKDYYEFLDRCLALGANPLLRSVEGDAPFHLLRWFTTPRVLFSVPVLSPTNGVVLLLRDSRLSINDRGSGGNTLLHRFIQDAFDPSRSEHKVSQALKFRGITWLLDFGADRKLENAQKVTPRQLVQDEHDATQEKEGCEGYKAETLADLVDVLDNYATVPNDVKRLSPLEFPQFMYLPDGAGREKPEGVCTVM